MFESGKKILILAPHTDDGEFGCGGTIAKLVEKNCVVHYAAFSVCEQSVPRHLPKNILEGELKNACKVLSIKKENIHIYKFEVRKFPEYRQQILDEMIILKKQVEPDVVFLPSHSDIHQDHSTVAAEGFRAFKDKTILGYEMPWNNLSFTTSCFCKIEQKHVDLKIKAMEEYKSQSIRPYAKKEFIYSLATVRGVQIKAEYAEAFQLFRLII